MKGIVPDGPIAVTCYLSSLAFSSNLFTSSYLFRIVPPTLLYGKMPRLLSRRTGSGTLINLARSANNDSLKLSMSSYITISTFIIQK